MKRLFAFTLGFLTAIGGFLDVGDLVANSLVGARFGMSLAWVVPVGVVGAALFTEMSARVSAISGRATFDLVRERMGARAGLANLLASYTITLLTLAAEIGGVALALEIASSVHYLLWVPVVLALVWIVLWRLPFQAMEQTYGLLGLALIAFAVALWQLGPDWGALLDGALRPAPPPGEDRPTWWYYAIAVFGAAMTPYTVLFFSSSGVEEGWTAKDLGQARVNVFVGFPLGGLLALAVMACAAVVFMPAAIQVEHLSQVALPVAAGLGRIGLAVVIVGLFAATFGAALEAALAAGYSVAQYFGWAWGKTRAPVSAPRFHSAVLLTLLLGTALILTSLDPVKVTEYSIVLSAAALPLTYLPILIVANDRDYLGEHVNSRFTNVLATGYLALVLVVSAVTLPLMIYTKAGQ
ncbi:NRAMP family divalent metal transporter [Streptomonospora nanhaiensis]|uniref:Mn2+/Fe2+ NRAMP family transporter n=1 Tax=Streptomonospora nanhaiensis TaxID=1323731 RepID=A0A853BR11_9ACTN|nr:divalent metal cation transporter [Streptomonospora nanhaiensis]MBV2363995.1 divalent metal cation transporter [Streptomonospora nanhaiensis]MBX9387339.1 divalent metal cation transporter [Streptomonospora nanhaiensis]NYI96997.1 Mn2+/Fe2+ NRAMP family transporter [Streptomonospora nanhaiensis]